MAQYNSKVIFAGETLIDLTSDTVEAGKLLKGITAHDKSGAPVTGSCTFDADTSDGTAAEGEILSGKTAYVNGRKVTGTMPDNDSVSGTISNKDIPYTVPMGYHDGSGTVQIDEVEKLKIVAGNIRQGITILGVTGTMTGSESIKVQEKTVKPKKEQQIVAPDEEYDYLTQVTVEAIPYSTSENPAGGNTVTIG